MRWSQIIKKSKRKLILVLVVALMFSTLCGCNSSEDENSEGTEADVTPAPYKGDDYATYIHDALESVSKDSQVTPIPTFGDKEDKVIMVPNTGTEDNDSIYVSASEALPEDSGITPSFGGTDESSASEESKDNPESTDGATEEANTEGAAEENAELTPDEFEVGTCCIYINGENDTTYGADIIKAINKARTDLGYKALNEKKGLDTCADRRTREIASFLNHYRPNATPFYSLAPQYFKAEMLAIDGAKAEETVDAWIADPYSRQLVFTTKYTSVGAACFKCNGLNCVVVAFGY